MSGSTVRLRTLSSAKTQYPSVHGEVNPLDFAFREIYSFGRVHSINSAVIEPSGMETLARVQMQ